MKASHTNKNENGLKSGRKDNFCTSQPSSRTYFISGFDPRGAAYYLSLFQKELRHRGYRTGKKVSNGLLTRWPLEVTNNSKRRIIQGTKSELSFLHWDDIARANWPRNPFEILRQCLKYASFYLVKGTILKIAKLCPGVALCGAYPLLFIILSIILSTSIGNTIYAGLRLLSGPEVINYLLTITSFIFCLFLSWKSADKLGVVWLTRSILFTHRLGEERDNLLRKRVKKLAAEIIKLEEKSPAKFIKMIGHSSGSFVLVMLAAELKRSSNGSNLMNKIELITLGQNLANLSIYPKANQFREDLQILATEPRLPWKDVTSKEDLLCFAGVDPFQSCGLTMPIDKAYPQMKIISLRMRDLAMHNKKLIFNQFDLHFDYLRNYCPEVDLPGLLIADSKEYSNA